MKSSRKPGAVVLLALAIVGVAGEGSLSPLLADPTGYPAFRASHDQHLAHTEPSIAMNPANPKNLVARGASPSHRPFGQ